MTPSWLLHASERHPAAATAVAVLLLVLVGMALRPRAVARPLMTRVERETITHLEAAVPWCRVHAQVCLGALLQPARWLPKAAAARSRYRYGSKIVDFVLEDRRTGTVVALVELDDRWHSRSADQARDRLTGRAGYLTIRLPASEYPTRAGVQARVAAALNLQRQRQGAGQAREALADLRPTASAGAGPGARKKRRGQ